MKKLVINVVRAQSAESIKKLAGHDLYDNTRHRIARVAGLGEKNFTYYLYDESKQARVLDHITRLAKGRSRMPVELFALTDVA